MGAGFPGLPFHFFTDRGTAGWPSNSYELVEADDVHAVLRWADENADGRIYVVYVVVDSHDGRKGLQVLAGYDPNWPEDPRRPPS